MIYASVRNEHQSPLLSSVLLESHELQNNFVPTPRETDSLPGLPTIEKQRRHALTGLPVPMHNFGSMSPPDRFDSTIWTSDELETLQSKSVEPVHLMTPLRTAERTPPPSTSRAHHSPPFSPLTPTLLSPISSPTHNPRAAEKPMTPLQSAMASDEEALPGEMTAVDGDAEMLVDEPTESEQLTEFEQHTAQARELSRKDFEAAKNSGIRELQHSSPGPKIQATAEGRGMSQEQRPEAQSNGQDLGEAKPEAMPSRIQATWVTGAVTACQANKKV